MESISRISGLLESARDLTLEAARDASALRKPSGTSVPTAALRKLLDSRNEREVLDGLRRVITLSHRKPPSSGPPLLFSSVLKNIANPSLAVKKLVYIYLLEHAEAEPDTALLAINTIQKTLSAPDPHLRALALRVMAGIRVPVISQIVSLAIKKGSTDISPIVRKAAALAIPKCWRLDPATHPQLVEYMSVLLGDRQYYVSGAAVVALMECCPERIELLHKHYRSLVRKMVDMDEWAQLAMLRCMTIYARRCFPRKTKRVKKFSFPGAQKAALSIKGFYGENDTTSDTYGDHAAADGSSLSDYEEITLVDPDLSLLLKAALPLLQSRNSAVITAVTRLYLYLAPPPSASTTPAENYLANCTGPLVSLLRSPLDMQQIALHSILQVALCIPQSFLPYTTHFLLRSTDTAGISMLKLELLSILFPHASHHIQSLILSELSHSFRSSGTSVTTPLLTASVRALGRCAASTSPGSATSTRCLRLLLAQLTSTNGLLVAESLTVIRHLIQADPAAHVATVTRLAKTLDTMTNPQARATVVWLVGEFAGTADAGGNGNIAADVLRLLAKGFADEAEAVKLQIVLLAAKVYVHHLNAKNNEEPPQQDQQYERLYDDDNDHQEPQHPDHTYNPTTPHPQQQTQGPIPLLWTYIQHLTRYDPSYDLRTRARLYKSLLSHPSKTQLASLLLLAPKPVPRAETPAQARQQFTLGSASLVLGPESSARGFNGYESVPEWVPEGREPAASLRDEDAGAHAHAEYYRSGGAVAMSASERLDAVAGAGTGAAAGATMFGRRPGAGADDGGVVGPTRGAGAGAGEKSLDDWLAEEDEGGAAAFGHGGGRGRGGATAAALGGGGGVDVDVDGSSEGSSEEEDEEDDDEEEEDDDDDEEGGSDDDESSEDGRDEKAKLVR